MVGRRLVFLLALLWPAALPAEEALTWRDAVERLTLERERAESGVHWLRDRAGGDAVLLADGERLYDEARIRFEAYIEGLLVHLAEGGDIEDVPALRRKLEEAVQHRLAFSTFVAEQAKAEAGSKVLLLDALAEAAGDIVKALVDGGIAIWKEYHRVDEDRRKVVAAALERQRWLPFDSVS